MNKLEMIFAVLGAATTLLVVIWLLISAIDWICCFVNRIMEYREGECWHELWRTLMKENKALQQRICELESQVKS